MKSVGFFFTCIKHASYSFGLFKYILIIYIFFLLYSKKCMALHGLLLHAFVKVKERHSKLLLIITHLNVYKTHNIDTCTSTRT